MAETIYESECEVVIDDEWETRRAVLTNVANDASVLHLAFYDGDEADLCVHPVHPPPRAPIIVPSLLSSQYSYMLGRQFDDNLSYEVPNDNPANF